MFYSCYSLTSINISNFNITNSVNINYLFDNCKNLTLIDISSFHRNTCDYIYSGLPEKGRIFMSNDYYNYAENCLPFGWEIINITTPNN